MTMKEFNRRYWRYYLMLEEEFSNTLNFVELTSSNYSTISIKYVNLLLSIGSEIDNVFKACSNLSGRVTITDYIGPILNKYPSIVCQSVLVKYYNMILSPYAGWNSTYPSQSLLFWKTYNEVKHDRIGNYPKASLEIVLNALAGLFILEMYLTKDIYMNDTAISMSIPEDDSKIFVLENWDVHVRTSKLNSEYKIFDDDNGGQEL